MRNKDNALTVMKIKPASTILWAAVVILLFASNATAQEQVFPWPYCIYYAGQAKETRVIYANTEAGAFITMGQLIAKANQASVALGYAALWRAAPGNCP